MKTTRANSKKSSITRRSFAFWIGFSAFALGETLNAKCLDRFAALSMKLAPSSKLGSQDEPPVYWKSAENETWRWFERETFLDGRWKVTGRTTPIHKETGEAFTGRSGYLSEELVPDRVRRGLPQLEIEDASNQEAGTVSGVRRARHGRPPSKWLRSLEVDELRIWLKTIEVPETGVSGMTFSTHLTRDHSFDAEKIKGLTDLELEKLHSAAHYGY